MSRPRVLVLRAPGTNCDEETAFAFEKAGAEAERIHVNSLIESPKQLDRFQILCIPGGFSYGDDIAAGRILANQMSVRLADCLQSFHSDEKLILGICNGFQVLMKSGLLVDETENGFAATLTWNDCGQYEDRWVNLDSTNSNCVFLQGVERMYLPIAHAEGRFVVENQSIYDQLMKSEQLALKYTVPHSQNGQSNGAAQQNGHVPFPFNPNGSVGNVAGVCDPTGRVFGLMPHPERFIDRTHHPRWTRMSEDLTADGIQIFDNSVKYFQ